MKKVRRTLTVPDDPQAYEVRNVKTGEILHGDLAALLQVMSGYMTVGEPDTELRIRKIKRRG